MTHILNGIRFDNIKTIKINKKLKKLKIKNYEKNNRD